jgi:hypothetical protein
VDFKQAPSEDELEWLHEAEWIMGTAKTPGWTLIKNRMKKFVDAAQTTIDENLSSNAEVVYRLHLRRQVMKSVVNDIITWVEGTAMERERMIQDLESAPIPVPQRIGDEFSGEESEYDTTSYAELG